MPAEQAFPQPIWNIAMAFVALHGTRYEADYYTAELLAHAEADIYGMQAEAEFIDWAAVRSTPPSDPFLAESLCRGIPRR